MSGVKSLFIKEDKKIVSNRVNQGIFELSRKELQKIETLKNMIIVTVDKNTSMTSVTVTLQNPKVAAIVADSVVGKLQEYIITYRTSKAKEDCLYLEKLFKERQQEYYIAQKEYANYMDSHDDIILQSVRTEQERLQNDMNLAYQVYSQVSPSGISKKIYVLAFVFLLVGGVMAWTFFGKDLFNQLKEISA